MSKNTQIKNIQDLIRHCGDDPQREGLRKTPERVVDSMEFLTSGYNKKVDEVINGALFTVSYDDMIVVRNIEFYSLCEHHMLPFYGICHVGYIPDQKILGLSKIPKIVDVFSRRLQVQERLTHEIAHTLQDVLNPLGVGVVMEGYHLCMMMRGVEKQNSFTVTSSMQGCFRNTETRAEFMSHVRSAKP
jgi:GTP cyclohydrolase I